jgi:hypothetical protein
MPRNYTSPEHHEWSHLVDVEKIESGPKIFSFKASAEQRANLARRLGQISVESATASVTLQRVGGGIIHAIGSVQANITQSCVVSLVPVEAHVEEEFEGWFGDNSNAVSFAKARSEREAKKGHVEAEILEESVDPEPVINGKVDIGELATQFLSLAIDPYPHAPGVSGEFLAGPQPDKGEVGKSLRKNPFEALKDWKEKR